MSRPFGAVGLTCFLPWLSTLQHAVPRRPSTWQPAALAVTNGTFGYSALCDVPQRGRGGVLWESKAAIVFSTFALEF